MYAIYREQHPPTGVEHCLECHFFDLKRRSLVVAATSVLRVYDILQQVSTSLMQELLVVHASVKSIIKLEALVCINWNATSSSTAGS